jgi:hypothetical protein
MSLTAGGTRNVRRLFVRLVPAGLPAFAWLRAGGRVDAFFGVGANAGRLMLTGGATLPLLVLGPTKDGGRKTLTVMLGAPDWVPAGKFAPAYCAFDAAGEALVIRMPDWGMPDRGVPDRGVPDRGVPDRGAVAAEARGAQVAPEARGAQVAPEAPAARPEGMEDIGGLLRDAEVCSSLSRQQREALRGLRVRAKRECSGLKLCDADVALLREVRAKVYGL